MDTNLQDMKLEFAPREEGQTRSKGYVQIPENTIANVQLGRALKDRDTGEQHPFGHIPTGVINNTPVLKVPLEIVSGQYAGHRFTQTIFLNASEDKFRSIFEVITGIDTSEGPTLDISVMIEALTKGVYEVKLGSRPDKEGTRHYTTVRWWRERVGEREAPESQPQPEGFDGSQDFPADADEDSPFG